MCMLAHFNRSSASRAVGENAGANNRIIEPAPPYLVFSKPAPLQGVSLNEIEENCHHRGFRYSNGRHVKESTVESSIASRSNCVLYAIVFRGDDQSLARRALGDSRRE